MKKGDTVLRRGGNGAPGRIIATCEKSITVRFGQNAVTLTRAHANKCLVVAVKEKR